MSISISIDLRYGAYILALYFCVTNLFSQSSIPVSENDLLAPAKNSKVTNIILMVVDALRSDMISSSEYSKNWPNLYAVMDKGIVQCFTASLTTPSVTSPRIKAIATGQNPEFIDFLYNLQGSGIKQPSWIQLMARNNRSLELYGDDTWLRLFPGAFKRSDGTTSFYVTDFFEVDINVTRHLDSRLKALHEWDLMVLHFLGLDHIGHVQGPRGKAMALKLQEMDAALGKIVSALNASAKDWLLILTGDHGMSDQGSHGGGSFSELTTSMILISPKFKKRKLSACAIDGALFEAKSDQTDLATVLGLLTGVGVPACSIGVPPLQVLQTFWPEPLQRYFVLLELLEHIRQLTKCTETKCDHEFLVPNEAVKLNELHTEVSSIVRICSALTPPHPVCARMATEMSGITTQVINLLTAFQRRTLLHTSNIANFNSVGLICFVMAAISISFLVPGIRDIFCRTDSFAFKSSYRDKTLVFTLLAGSSLLTLIVHLISLMSSSLIEEEHQTWYFITTTNCFALLFALGFSTREGGASRNNSNALYLVSILFLDRFLLRQLNHTGDRWIHLPDLTNWLEEHSAFLWIAVLLSWIVILLTRCLLAPPTGPLRVAHLRAMLALASVALTQLVYRIFIYSMEPSRMHSSSSLSPSLIPARLAFAALVVDLATCLWFLIRFIVRPGGLSESFSLHVTSYGSWAVPSPVHVLALLACLLGRSTSVLLWAGVILKEVMLARIFHNEFATLSASHSQARSRLIYSIAMLYWMEGWVTFFQQGNSNKFSTVDMAAGYVGLSDHSHILSTLMVLINTYAGPMFWQLSLWFRYLLNLRGNAGDEVNQSWKTHVKRRVVGFLLGFLTTATTVSAVVCFLMHSHLFIWSVFAPKLFFLAAYCCLSIPLYALMLVF